MRLCACGGLQFRCLERTHSHVLGGGGGGRSLEHKDSMGNREVVSRGDVQFTSAGTGIVHSEFNGETRPGGPPVRFLQIWAVPERRGLTPGYQTGTYTDASKRDALCPILVPAAGSVDAGPAARAAGAPMRIHNALRMYACLLGAGVSLPAHDLAGRRAYVSCRGQRGSRSRRGGARRGRRRCSRPATARLWRGWRGS